MQIDASGEALSEPVIAMMKPDAFERGLIHEIMEQLKADGFVEERRKIVQLSVDQVRKYFLHPTPEYVAHLTSRPVSMHLLRGRGGPERLYDLKREIRRQLGAPDKLRNLIHATDEGTEYHMFLENFFPELPELRHCGAADLDMRFPPETSVEVAKDTLDQLDAESDLVWASITIQPGQESLFELQKHSWKRLRVAFSVFRESGDATLPCAFLVHAGVGENVADLMPGASTAMPRGSWQSIGQAVTMTDLRIPDALLLHYKNALLEPDVDIDQVVLQYPLMGLLLSLKSRGLSRLNVFTPNRRLMETELLGDLARVANVHVSGGSAGNCKPGSFSVSQFSARDLSWA